MGDLSSFLCLFAKQLPTPLLESMLTFCQLDTALPWHHNECHGISNHQPHDYYTPRTTKLFGGYTGFTLSVHPSVRQSRMPCPLCNIYSYEWILFILGTNDHYHERVCRTPWPLTLTYIFKVIWPWLRKSCPLCSVYSSEWILFIFGTNDHYH